MEAIAGHHPDQPLARAGQSLWCGDLILRSCDVQSNGLPGGPAIGAEEDVEGQVIAVLISCLPTDGRMRPQPLDEKPIEINSPLGLLPECEELVSVSAERW